MKKIIVFGIAVSLICSALLSGCRTQHAKQKGEGEAGVNEQTISIQPSSEIVELEDGLSVVRYDGDYGFNDFLIQGGASSDGEVIEFLASNLFDGNSLEPLENLFGCSTISAKSSEGNVLFGRNFDWDTCDALIVEAHPQNGYASISTVNLDFITGNASGTVRAALLMDQVKTMAALYAPLDGMNEAGLVVSVNMIQDSATINQVSDKPDITTTTAVRMLLDQASNVEEALELLDQYDLHASMGMMVHFAIADAEGNSVAVEYVNNEKVVTETSVLTNFYLAEGEKKGIGTAQSHERYDILMDRLAQTDTLEVTDIRDALDSVSKDNFNEFESTEWSVVMNQSTRQIHYYHRENYQKVYILSLSDQEGGESE